MIDSATLAALLPVVILLFLGVVTAIGSRALRVSPIVGYLALGLALRVSGAGTVFDRSTIELVGQMGVMFLLFDIGLHFSIEHVRKQAADIFMFGPLQVAFATAGLGVLAVALGLSVPAALMVGAILALSSTAVVARLIAERHQRNCPVGLTATSILVFQDVVAIFLLIISGSMAGSGPLWRIALVSLLKGAMAFGLTVLIARLVVGPVLRLVAESRNEEVFTATALLIALAAGWATGYIGLSLTLGAFLGGIALAETPYRAVIESEIKPFRGLLLGFFFVSIGLSVDVAALGHSWVSVLLVTGLMIAVKILTNIAASRVFRWSVPGSTQLGFLLAQGSEFAFVILTLPAVRNMVGTYGSAVVIAAVALSMALTPTLAEAGRRLAGHMRTRAQRMNDPELEIQESTAPVIIVGMGTIGRTLADALRHFRFGYYAIERDQQRLQLAIADGYTVAFGDGFDPRMWGPNNLQDRKLSVITAPDIEALSATVRVAKANFPGLKRFAIVKDDAEAGELRSIGLLAIVDRSQPPGLDVARVVLGELGLNSTAIDAWMLDQRPPLRVVGELQPSSV